MELRNQDTRALAIATLVASKHTTDIKTTVDEMFVSNKFSISKPNDKQNIVDSLNLGKRVRACIRALKSKNTECAGKLKLAEFLCNKLFGIFYLSEEKRDIIVDELEKTILNADPTIIPITLRLYYLRFRNELVSYKVSVKLFRNGAIDKLPIIPYFQILKYILRSSHRDDKVKVDVLNEFDSLFDDDDVSMYTKMEIADVFLLNGRVTRGNQMLDILRELEYTMVRDANDANNVAMYRRVMTVYDDSQNVHGTNLNESVLSACVRLLELESPDGFDSKKVRDILVEISPANTDQIETVLERVEIDTSRFKSDDNMFSLYDVFSSLWSYIQNHKSRDELYKRLIEEMTTMYKYCTTGHVSRFMNVIQGFTNDEKLCIRISAQQQIKAVISNYLDKIMGDAPEAVMDAMIDEDQKLFYDYIVEKLNTRIGILVKEYGDIHSHIIHAVKAYSRWDYWSFDKNILSWTAKPFPQLKVGNSCTIEDITCPLSVCSHTCSLDGKESEWTSDAIRDWYIDNNIKVPLHFSNGDDTSDDVGDDVGDDVVPLSKMESYYNYKWCIIL